MLQDVQGARGGPGIAVGDLARREPLPQQRLRLRQQFPGERHDEPGAVSHFLLRGLGGRHEQVGGRVFDLELADDGGGVRGHEELVEVVDDDLFHPCFFIIFAVNFVLLSGKAGREKEREGGQWGEGTEESEKERAGSRERERERERERSGAEEDGEARQTSENKR